MSIVTHCVSWQVCLQWELGDTVHDMLVRVKRVVQLVRSAEADVAAIEPLDIPFTFTCRSLSMRTLVLVCSYGQDGALPKLVATLQLGNGTGQAVSSYRLEYLKYAGLGSGQDLDILMKSRMQGKLTEQPPNLVILLECWRSCVYDLVYKL